MGHLIRFFLQFISFTVIVAFMLKSGASRLPAYFSYQWQLELIFFFFVSGGLIHVILSTFVKKQPEKFVLVYMSVTVTKFLLLLSLVAFVIVKFNDTAIPFAVNFLILYFLYTAFELWHFLPYLNKKQEIQKPNVIAKELFRD